MVDFLDYVESLGFLGEDKVLQNTTGKIVLDAGIFFAAHRRRLSDSNKKLSQAYSGGSYLWLADTVTKVINNLRRHNVEPIVVAVNIETDQKPNINRQEHEAYVTKVKDPDVECPYSLQFPLRHVVIATVLRDLEVELLVGDGGRLLTSAKIANELGCPILSIYCSPLFYPIHAGVMLIGGREHWKYQSSLYSEEGVLVREWNYQEFMSHHGIGENDYALVFAADELRRKDMTDHENPGDFYETLLAVVKESSSDEARIDKLLRLLGSQDLDEAKLQFREYRNIFRETAKARPGSATLVAYLRSNDFKHETKNRRLLPPVYQERMRRNRFPRSCWSMLVTRTTQLPISEEHPDMVSAELCSRRIRQFSYDLLLNFDGPPFGEEYFFNDGKNQRSPTKTDASTDVALDEIPDLTVDERLAVLFKALDVDPANERDVLSSETPLLTTVIQYWVKYCEPSQVHQDAIGVWTQFDDLRDKYRRAGYRTPRNSSCSSQKRRELLHPFAQLSAILHDAVELSRLLLDPCGDIQIQEVFDVPYLLHIVLQSRNE